MTLVESTAELIHEQILKGMVRSGVRVAVHVNRRGHLLTIVTMRSADVPQVIGIDDRCAVDCQGFLKELQPGEALVLMTTHGTDHVGIYKLAARSIH